MNKILSWSSTKISHCQLWLNSARKRGLQFTTAVLGVTLFASAAPVYAGDVLFVSDSLTDAENIPYVLSGGSTEVVHPDSSLAALGARFRPAANPAVHHDVTIFRNDYDVTGGTFGLAEGTNKILTHADLPLANFCSVFWSASGPHEPDVFGGGLGADGGLHTDTSVFTRLNSYVDAGGFVFVTGHDAVANPDDPLLTEFVGGAIAASGQTFGPSLSLPVGDNALTLGPKNIYLALPLLGGINMVDGVQEQDYLALYDSDTTVVVKDLNAGLDPPAGSWTVRHPYGLANEFINKGHVAYVANGIFLYEDLPSSPGAFLSTGEDSSWLSDPAYNGALTNFAANSCISLPFDADETPVADSQAVTTPLNTAVNITLTGSDPSTPPDPITFSVDSAPASGSLSGTAPNLTYTPNTGFSGADSFTFVVSDGTRISDPGTVDITVIPNTDPVALDDSSSTDEDTPVTINVLVNDEDVDGDTLAVTEASDPANGTTKVNTDDTITYTPKLDYYGEDTFSYTIGDGNGGSDTATVTITVNPVNDAPAALDDSYTTDEDTPLIVAAPGVLANDSDVEGDTLTVTSKTGPSHGDVTISADGSFTYTPEANFNGLDSFVYSISDGNGGSGNATVTITVNPVNDPPVASDDAYPGTEDIAFNVAAPGVLGNDSDVDGDGLTAVLLQPTVSGLLGFSPDGSFSYTPNPQFCGADTFTYQADDTSLRSNTATVTLNIACVNDVPVANDDAFSTNEDTVLNVAAAGVLANDIDIDGDTLTAMVVSGPGKGSLTLNDDGSFSYTPNANYFGGDSFTYKANDGVADSDVATVTITINAVNDPPVIQPVTPLSQTVDYSDNITDVIVMATDVDSPVLILTDSGIPASLGLVGGCVPDNTVPAGTGGICSWTLSGVVTVPESMHTVGFTVTDDRGLTDAASAAINVEAEDATATLDENNAVALQVAAEGGDSGPFSLMVVTRETLPDNAHAGAPAAGDITRAMVTIALDPVGPGSSIPGACVTTTKGTTGYGQYLETVCTFNDVPVNTYSVMAAVNGVGYYTGGDEDALTIYDPSLGFTTGGGWFYWPETDDRTNFGYTMKYGKNGRNVKGNLLLIRHTDTGKYRIKSNALEGLALGEAGTPPDTFGWASFSGKSTYIEPGWPDAVGNHEFTVYVEDLGEPGAGFDRFWLEVRDKDRNDVPEMSMDEPADVNAATINGGNIVVPHTTGGGGGKDKKK